MSLFVKARRQVAVERVAAGQRTNGRVAPSEVARGYMVAGTVVDTLILDVREERGVEAVLADVVPGERIDVVPILHVHPYPDAPLFAIAQTGGLAGVLARLGKHGKEDRGEDGNNRDHDE